MKAQSKSTLTEHFGRAIRGRSLPIRDYWWNGRPGRMLLHVLALTLGLLVMAGCVPVDDVITVTPEQAMPEPTKVQVRSDQPTDQEMEAFLQAHAAAGGFMGAVLVARGNEVVHSAGYGMANLEHQVSNTPQTVFRLGSLTKQFTAAAILQLQEQGRLDVNDPVDRYLPDYPHGSEITIHQLLNHTSGTPDYEFLRPRAALRNAVSLDGLMATFSGMPLDFPPGSQFNYSNSGYVILTRILEEVSGERYADYVAEHIFRPLGMEATGYEDASAILPHRAAGYIWDGTAYHNSEFFDISNAAGAGGLVSTVLDMYKWDRALYRGDVLGHASREAYFAPTVVTDEGAGYAYGWLAKEISGRNYIMHTGGINGFSAAVIRYTDEELYVVVLSNVESRDVEAVAAGLAAIALGDAYDVPVQHTAVEVDPTIYEKYVGRYQLTREIELTVTTEAGHLFLQATNGPRFEVFPESETDYFATVVNLQLHFQVGADGNVTGLTVLESGQELQLEKIE